MWVRECTMENSFENSFTETSTVSYGGRVKNAFFGMIIGLVLFIGSFVLLGWNEGNAVNLVKKEDFISKNAIPVKSDQVDKNNDLKMIATNGKVHTAETLSDSIVSVEKALRLRRTVEMYQWVEHKKTKEHKNSDGRVTKTTTYSYDKKWDTTEHDSKFYKKGGYENPKFQIKSDSFSATSATMGAFTLHKDQIDRINGFVTLRALKPVKGYEIVDRFYYKGRSGKVLSETAEGSEAVEVVREPEVGDVRISYSYVPSGETVSILGQQRGDAIAGMFTSNGEVYLQYDGPLTLEGMLNRFKRTNMLMTYGLRLLGCVLMYLGMWFLISPIVVISSYVPFLGGIADFVSSLVLWIIAIVLSLLTIAIAWFAYRPVLSVTLLVLAAVTVYGAMRAFQSTKSRMSERPAMPEPSASMPVPPATMPEPPSPITFRR